jgi:hypothetical protein
LISVLRGSTAGDRIGAFGVSVLTNGNYLLISQQWDNGAVVNAGAVTFGSAVNGVSGVVSPSNSLVGSSGGDQTNVVVTPLHNGNYVVSSPIWDNGAVVNAGAVTFGSGTSGIRGVISPANSLVGRSAFDVVGSTRFDGFGSGVTALSNGNYVVSSPNWDHGAIGNVGAVTFGSGTNGISGEVSPENSLIGGKLNDSIGDAGVTALSNGNYVVRSASWDNEALQDVGAMTFGSGISGISGIVSSANSLVGSTQSDFESASVIALSNGSYVVRSPKWNNGTTVDAGAVTFGSGTGGISGIVSPANSLVGSKADDRVGTSVTELSNGNYVVRSTDWDNGSVANAGAVTFGSGLSGVVGLVSSGNSLVGSSAGDRVGDQFSVGVTPLSNGHYVVSSPSWDNGTSVDVGAATFGSGLTGISGVISSANSLIGSTANDSVGSAGITALSNGNYVVSSPSWDNGPVASVGAATFASGLSGISGVISPANSLIGSQANDAVGRAFALSNGNYVVESSRWKNGTLAVGAVTFGSGITGISGVVSAANSLIGSRGKDRIGGDGVIALSTGDYVVLSSEWANGSNPNAGAVTFGSGTVGITGQVSPANSLVGSSANDRIGMRSVPPNSPVSGLSALSNGNYLVRSQLWDNGTSIDAGAVTLGLSNGSVSGPISNAHSVMGSLAYFGETQAPAYDPVRNQLAVGEFGSNRVVLHRPGLATGIVIVGETPDPSYIGQAVSFTATVSALPNAPADGLVTFTSSSGEKCTDTSPTATSTTTAEFSCTITFTISGSSIIVAEYTGSVIHAYNGSEPVTHTTIGDDVFSNGFEDP